MIGFVLIHLTASASSIELKDAFYDKELEITIRGLKDTELAYEGKDIWIGVLNLKAHPVTITVEPGFILSSESGDVQDMIITEPLQIVASNEYFTESAVEAMCIQSINKSPADEDIFRPGEYAPGSMGQLARFIHKNNYNNHMGQEAMWVLSDNHPIYDITGPDADAIALRKYVAKLTGTTYDPSLAKKDIQYIDRRVKEYALYLKFYLEERDDIKLQVFNQKGEYERDLLMRPDAEKGRYDMRYKISLFGMIGEKYYVRLFVGDQMRKEFTLVIKET